MTKIALQDIESLTNEQSFITRTNQNYDRIESASDSFLSRDGTTPNFMTADFDMNSHRILNMSAPASPTDPVRLQDITASIETLLEALHSPFIVDTGEVPYFATRTVAQLASIAGSVSFFFTQGYSAVGDNGGGLFERVVAQPSHAGKIQSGDGAWWELSNNQIITPEQFGAKSDGVTVDTTALKNLSTYVTTKGSARVCFKANAVYIIWDGVPTNQDIVMDFRSTTLNAVDVDFNGAQIKTTGTWGVGTVGYGIYLQGGKNYRFRNGRFRSNQQMALSIPSDLFGEQWFWVDPATAVHTENIIIENMVFDGGRTATQFARLDGPTNSGRVRNIVLNNIKTTNIFYGFAFAKDGDNVLGRGLYTKNAGRGYFPYNIRDHDIHLTEDSTGFQVPSCLIALKVNDTETAAMNTIENVKLLYRLENTNGLMQTTQLINLAFQQDTGVSTGGIMRNIDICVDVTLPNASTTSGSYLIATSKAISGNGVDPVVRGYLVENISFSGTFDATSLQAGFCDMFNETTWAGESVRNVRFHDLSIRNVNVAIDSMKINMAPFTAGNLILENIDNVGTLLITNKIAGRLFLTNIVSSDYSTTKSLTSALAPTWGNGSGTQPVIGNGSIVGRYHRIGSRVLLNIQWQSGSTTTYGNAASGYFFQLPSLFNDPPVLSGSIGSAIAFQNVTATFRTGTVLLTSSAGVARASVISDTSGNWHSTSPGVWQQSDFIELTAVYDV